MAVAAPRYPSSATLRSFAHDVLNPVAAIRMSAGALLMSKALTESERHDLRRMEEASVLVAEMVGRLTKDAELAASAYPARPLVNLHTLCCELAAWKPHGLGHRAIHCRAFGDPRGPWDPGQAGELVSRLLDRAIASLGKRAVLSIVVSGFPRHVRLDLHGLGWMTEKHRRVCIEESTRILNRSASLKGDIAATASSSGLILSIRLAK